MIFDKCARYRKYKMLSEDGKASERQCAFVDLHESSCPTCLDEHVKTLRAISYLKENVMEPSPSDDLELKILRCWRSDRRNRAVSYWMPAVAGAVVAGAALLAVLQILIASPEIKKQETKGREALLLRSSGATFSTTDREEPVPEKE